MTNEPAVVLNRVLACAIGMEQLIQQTQITQPHMPNKFTPATIPTKRFLQSLTAQPTNQQRTPADWHTGLVDCCAHDYECGFCLLACVCPCVAYGMNYSLLVGEKPCNVRFCCSPCLLFAVLEAVEMTVTAAASVDKINRGGRGPDVTGLFQLCMLYQHRYAVGRRARIYLNDDCCTQAAICCELTWCAPCAQAQLRSEVGYQRGTLSTQFKFAPPANSCCCKICCCEKDCGCTGCIEIDKY